MTSFKDFLNEYKQKEENKIVRGLNDLKKKLDDMKPIVDEYYEIQREYNQKMKTFEQNKKREELLQLKIECQFEECEYPSMGVSGFNGEANFKTKEQADNLINALRNNANYYHAYILKWSGPGKYLVVPDWKYDHDSEVVYTAQFIKEKEKENEIE